MPSRNTMTYSIHRPKGYQGAGDSHLPRIVKRLKRELAEVQRDLAFDTICLSDEQLSTLAELLVDFAEDLHGDIGIWNAYERYNREFFGTPLPLTTSPGNDAEIDGLHPGRFRHFLWILYPSLLDDLLLSPTHQDVQQLADVVSDILRTEFKSVPRDSGLRRFFDSPSQYGWEVKRKLIWLGTQSYLFRTIFANYIADQGDDEDTIALTDDFICQHCSRWSGLGPIDILAGVLDIPEGDRQCLRGWYERHASFYLLRTVSNKQLNALNVVNDQPYLIRIDMKRHPFKVGQLIFGSLVPWRGDWYWSGKQQLYHDASEVDLDDLKQTMRVQHSQIVCRFDKDYEAAVHEHAAKLHESMMAFYGKDLIQYQDGLSMAADWQKEFRHNWQSKSPQQVKDAIKKHCLKKGRPDMTIPDALLNEDNGLGVFINPDEGKEIMQEFFLLVSGLQRRGVGLIDEEECVIRGFMESENISPRFVRRVCDEYGSESIKQTFMLRDNQPDYWLDYLLRCYKGEYYRKRYPFVSVI